MIPYEEKVEEESVMKKLISLLLAAILLLAALPVMADSNGKALIFYFDYSENIDTKGLDVDAVSSASIAEGPDIRERSNLLVMVDLLQERTGAEVYPLHIQEVYRPMFMDMVDKAQEDKDNDVQFTFADSLPDLTDVDTIYFGSAIWWNDMPQPVINFFQRTDLSGKNLVYFSINRGSGNWGNLELLEQLQPGVNVAADVSISAMQDNDSAAQEFSAWLDSIGL